MTHIVRPTFYSYTHDFRNHIACTSNDNKITYTNVLAAYFVFVVQRRISNSNAANKYRNKSGNWSKCARASYLYIYVNNLRCLLSRRIFVCCREIWFAMSKP